MVLRQLMMPTLSASSINGAARQLYVYGNGFTNYHVQEPHYQAISWSNRLKLRKALKKLLRCRECLQGRATPQPGTYLYR